MSVKHKKIQTEPSWQNAIAIKGLNIHYGKFHALKDVNLSIKKGECFGIIGVNGAGKTSLLKTILGFRRATEGQVTFFDNCMSEKQRKYACAFLPEKFEPTWFMTGKGFLQFSAKLYGKPYQEDRVHEYADLLRLDVSFLSKSVSSYSKGMRQKLGLLAVVMSEADLLIFDEPMSGLDPFVRGQVKNLFKRLHEEGRTLVISSHILNDLEQICDRVALVNDRKISEIDTPQALIKKTKTKTLDQAFLSLIEKV